MVELSEAADLAWRIAALEAQRGRAAAISPAHLLIGLLSLEKLLESAVELSPRQIEGVRAEQVTLTRVLGEAGLDAVALRRAVRRAVPAGRAAGHSAIQRDQACRAVFERAEALAKHRPDACCSVLDLLAALLEQPAETIRAAIGNPERLRQRVALAQVPAPAQVQAPGPTPPPLAVPGPAPVPAPPPPAIEAPTLPAIPPILLRHGRDLTAEAEAGRLPPVIGRQDEMLQVVRVLRRRTKNGPVLVGEAGVGKTAVVEGLAQRIADGIVLPGCRIVALNIASVVAGTTYRGQFEERLEEIVAALHAHPEVILFLDELHNIVGAGASGGVDGRLDAASILKPALARGEIACIGATTLDEYHRHIEKDPALERRFQPVLVSEPSHSETLAILTGLRHDLEHHHGVRIEDEALGAAVELTVRHVPSRRLPDKAVDALDEACARASTPTLTAHSDGATDASPLVSRQTVAEVVSAWTGLPLDQVGPADASHLADLEARLAERIVGQGAAIRQLVERVRLARAGLADPERRGAVLLLVGPVGVGKTALGLALAETVAGGTTSQDHVIHLKLSEYAEQQHVPGLIGGSAGSYGRDREGQLAGPLRRNPGAVVVLDDLDRAHPDILDALLPFLATGRLTDGAGRTIDGRQATVVLTVRLEGDGDGRRAVGFRRPEAAASPTFSHEALLSSLRAILSPTILDRIDEIVPLRPLDDSDLLGITRRQVAALVQRLRVQHGIELSVTDEALTLLARRARTGSVGAHQVERTIASQLAEPVGRELLAGRLQPGAHILAEPHGDNLALLTPSSGAGVDPGA